MIQSQAYPTAHLTSSPTASPILRPVAGTLPEDNHSPRVPRSATRGSYTPARLARSTSRPRATVDSPTRAFAQGTADVMRARKARAAVLGVTPSSPGGRERDALEFIVDIPVWAPGCFADLSTLHALRDTTLAHVHDLLSHLATEHQLQGTYKLLARPPSAVGWAAIRLAASALDTDAAAAAGGVLLSPPPRRTSFVKPERAGSGGVPSPRTSICAPAIPAMPRSYEVAIADSDSEGSSADGGEPTPGYSSTEDDDDAHTDTAVTAEIGQRGGKEGMVFVAKVKGQLSLVLT